MMSYKFRYKRMLIIKTIKNAVGHRLNVELDRMDVFLDDGLISIPKWSSCTLYLESDYMLFHKKEIEKEAKQDVKIR